MTTAIAALENSMNIFEAKYTMMEEQKNHYGVALAQYALGYVYNMFTSSLCR